MHRVIPTTYLYTQGPHLPRLERKLQGTTLGKRPQSHLLGYRILFVSQRTERAFAEPMLLFLSMFSKKITFALLASRLLLSKEWHTLRNLWGAATCRV